MLVPDCPCLSLYVPDCPYLSLFVPVPVSTFVIPSGLPLQMNITVLHSYIDFPCKRHCCNACKPCFLLLLYFSSCFLNNSFIQSEQFYSSDKYHRALHLVSFEFFCCCREQLFQNKTFPLINKFSFGIPTNIL